MNPYNIHPNVMSQISLPNVFSIAINSNKLSEHITYWNGRGFSVIKGRPINKRKMMIKVRKNEKK